jgi:predicted porin
MKKYLGFLLILATAPAWSKAYIEGDALYPTLNLTKRTEEMRLDFRVGYHFEEWDVSARYRQAQDISYAGGFRSNASVTISDANDTYLALRAARQVGDFKVGLGLGNYRREFETSFTAFDRMNYDKSILALEGFASVQFDFGSFYVKPELNYIVANIPTHVTRSNGFSDYDITFPRPELSLLLLIGYQL